MTDRQPAPARRYWAPVQRLLETPDAVIMTSTGYVIGGHHIRTVPPLAAHCLETTPRPSFWQRLSKWKEERN
ncbi:hypothetical protein [Sphingopyxis yananensis]|uniref:hypothetical protein n=1 Tax=Sphingopyxis yananensis TaxID=2886687 RepID=UPI001D12B560|nr:hypothetical protein [Sphingopyxis yananensis]MCC2602250.1 hypothetical protein [Sphingopyxis yananensis]